MTQVIVEIAAIVGGTVIVAILSILFIPRAILLQSNQALRNAAADLKSAAEQAAAAEVKSLKELEKVTARYEETREAMVEQARHYRNEIGWLKEEFFRATGKWPQPMPNGYKAQSAVP